MSGRAVLALVGYGCFLSLSALSFWSPLSLVASAMQPTDPFFYVLVHAGLALSFAVALFAAGRSTDRLTQLLFAATLVLLVVGFILSDDSLRDVLSLPSPVLSAGALCTGLGFGFGLMCWLSVFASFSFKTAWTIIAIGSIVAALPTLGVSFFALKNSLSYSSFALVLLLVSLVALTLSLQGAMQGKGEVAEQVLRCSDPRPLALTTLVKRCGLVIPCIVVLSLFQPLLDASGLIDGLSPLSKTLLSQSGNVAGAVGMLVVGSVKAWDIDVSRVFLGMTPIFATVCLLFPFVDEAYWFIFSFVSMLLFSMLSMAVMLACLRSAREDGVPLLQVYGLLGFCLYSPAIIGMVLGAATRQVPGTPKLLLTGVLLLIVAICVFLALRIERVRLVAQGVEANVANAVVGGGDRVNTVAQAATTATDVSDRSIMEEGETLGARTLGEVCAQLSERHALTAREGEVLEMLAHGRNVPFIAEALHLSAHTVRGYVKALYQHLGVHSRQELIDLVESEAK